MEDDLNRLDNDLQQRDKSISSLQFEKANLAASVERLKGSDSSTYNMPIHVIKVNINMLTIHTEYQETLAAYKDERTKVQIHENRIAELEPTVKELTSQTEQQQQAIALLVSEKNTLSATVERLQDAESSMCYTCPTSVSNASIINTELEDTSALLEAERSRADRLQATVTDLTAQNHASAERISELSASEKSLSDKVRDLVRPLFRIWLACPERSSRNEKCMR